MSNQFTQEEIDRITRWEFKGLQDAMVLMKKRRAGPSVVGRWDWHLWMFIVSSLLPSFGVYCVAMWVRSGLWANYRKEQAELESQTPEADTAALGEHLDAMKNELQKIKLLVWLQGRQTPQLSPESLRRIYEKKPEETKTPVPDVKENKKESFSDRIWNRIKPWLPFYVEPFSPDRSKTSKTPPSPFIHLNPPKT